MTRPPVRGDDDWRPAHAPRSRTEEPAPAPPAADEHEHDEHEHEHEHDERWDDDPWEPDELDAGDFEPLRPEGRRSTRLLAVLLTVFALLVGAAGLGAMIVRSRLDPAGPAGDEVRVAIPTGSTNAEIANLLEDEGVVADGQAFRWYLRYKGAEGFQAGDYLFRENSAAWDALAVLQGRPLPPESLAFTVPEGLTLAEYPGQVVDDVPGYDAARVAELLASGAVRRPAALPPEATTYEGFLFPDTYQVEEGMDELAALTLMVDQFDRVAAEVGLVDRAAALGLTPYEVVTVASLIQEEYGIVEEMPKIARVIYNRLDIGEPLGIDATSRYEAELAGRDREDVDFDSDSPYNTRRNAGLPPTPIAAPGRAALEAALAPADGPWIFYVRDPDETRTPPGGHFFTDSAREFAAVKAECEEAGLGCG
jgi:UPF0755 protein